MLETDFFALPMATLLGFLSGLGTGGGSLLILWLTFVLKVPQADARIMNLMFFVPSALIACIFRWKQGSLNFCALIPGILAGCVAAALCSVLTAGQTSDLLRKTFGCLLIFVGIKEIFHQKKGP